MDPRTVIFPKLRRQTRPTPGSRGRTRTFIALAAALPMAIGLAAPAPAEAFTATSPTGVDVSNWQRPGGTKLDWKKVKASGEDFAFIKATDGEAGLIPYFEEDSKAAHEAGMIIGSYHKAHPDRDAIVQADAYAAALKLQPEGAKTLPPVLDMELDAGMSPQALEKWAATFLKRVEEKTGRTPMIYTYRWFWVNHMGNTNGLTAYPLWLAAYQDTPPTDVPGGWDEPLFWQRSSTGRVPGIPTIVDLNTFNGTDAQLDAIAGGKGAPAAKAPQTRGGKSEAQKAGEERAKEEADTGAEPDAVSPPTGRGAPGAGSVEEAPGSVGDVLGSSGADTAGADDATGNDDATAGDTANGDATTGDATTGDATTDSPVATSELVQAIIDALKAGSNGSDAGEAIAAVRSAAEAAGLDKAQIDLLIAYLERAMRVGDVPEGQLEEIGENAPTTEEAKQADDAKTGDKAGGDKADDKADDAKGGDKAGADEKEPGKDATGAATDQVTTLATYSDVVALLAGSVR